MSACEGGKINMEGKWETAKERWRSTETDSHWLNVLRI